MLTKGGERSRSRQGGSQASVETQKLWSTAQSALDVKRAVRITPTNQDGPPLTLTSTVTDHVADLG